mgnify:CR=1 FL=1
MIERETADLFQLAQSISYKPKRYLNPTKRQHEIVEQLYLGAWSYITLLITTEFLSDEQPQSIFSGFIDCLISIANIDEELSKRVCQTIYDDMNSLGKVAKNIEAFESLANLQRLKSKWIDDEE